MDCKTNHKHDSLQTNAKAPFYTLFCILGTHVETVYTTFSYLTTTFAWKVSHGCPPNGANHCFKLNNKNKHVGQAIIQFWKVMYLILTLQVPLTLQSVFSKTDSVFLKEDTQKFVFNNTCPRACISQYTHMGVHWLVQPLWHVLCDTHSWPSAQRMYKTLGLGSVSHLQTSPDKNFCQEAFG